MLCALALLVAGCGGPGSPEFTVPDGTGPEVDILPEDGNATPQPYTLNVVVREETKAGAPISGAAVVFFGLEGAKSVAVRTDANGSAVARFYVRGVVEVGAGGLPVWVDVRATGVVLGGPGETGSLTMVLYKRTLNVTVGGAATLNVGTPASRVSSDTPFQLHADAAVQEAYLARLETMEVVLHWSNAPTANGDLFAGLRVGPVGIAGPDERELPTDTNNEETLLLDEAFNAPAIRQDAAEELSAIAWSRGPVLGPVPVTFEITATFLSDNIIIAV